MDISDPKLSQLCFYDCAEELFELEYGEKDKKCEADLLSKIREYYLFLYPEKPEMLDREVLVEFIKKEARIPLLNQCLKEFLYGMINQVSKVEKEENLKDIQFFLNRLQYIHEINKKSMNYTFKKNQPSHSYVDKDLILKYMKEILLELDPTGSFLSLYLSAYQAGRIELIQSDAADAIYLRGKCGGSISVSLTNVPETFTSLLHEFAHYVTFLHEGEHSYQPLFAEYPSIFYEMYGIVFLIGKGYPAEEVLKVFYDRIENTKSLAHVLEPWFYFLEIYAKKEVVLKADLNQLPNPDEMIDSCIKDYLVETPDLPLYVSYILGTFFTLQIFQDRANISSNTLATMKYITENLVTLSPYRVIELTNIFIEENKKLVYKR